MSVLTVLAGTAVPGRVGAHSLQDDVDAFLTAYNAADSLVMQEFVSSRFESRVDAAAEARRWRRWYDVLGPLELVAATEESPSRLQAFALGSTTRGWAELILRPSREEPTRLRNIALGMGLHPGLEHVPGPPVPEAGLPRHLRAYLRDMAAADLFSGTLLVARNGRIVFQESVGFADRGARRPISWETRFNVGSVTKLATATAILRLVQEGRLALDAPVAKILPEAPMTLPPGLTVRHLLTHTGGLGRGEFDRHTAFPRELMSVDDLLRIAVAPPEFAPGEDVRYSNTGFLVLGKVIEAVTGESYFDYVEREVFRRVGMRASGFLELDRDPVNVARGYTHVRVLPGDSLTYEFGDPHNTLFMEAVRGSPAGGSYHTARDLLAWLEALREERLLNKEQTAMLLRDQVEIPMEPGMARTESYAFGWTGVRLDGHHFFTRDGGSNGVSARMDFYPDTGWEVVVLANLESIANLAANHVSDLLLRMP